ncbi:ATP-binding protein [Candidatus Bathyarchaeota archaeon]|nr:ATP-binding protein [Candidatus Bathyarchaeota archaeon]
MANQATALAELVKNSYDADAEKVTITFIGVKKLGGTIIVEDDGNGMDFQTVTNNWMRIATNVKKREIRSKHYKRIVTGSKGIGRFACRVLSNILILETLGDTKNKRKYKTKVTIDWRKYTSGSDLSKIKLPYERVRVSKSTDSNTIITLKNCRETSKIRYR